MRFSGNIFDYLERMGNTEFHGVLRRIGKKSVVPTAAIAKPSPISRKGKPWHNPAVYFLRRHDLSVDGLHNPHRAAAQVPRIEPFQDGKFVGLAVPARGNDLAAIPQQPLNVGANVDFVWRGEIDGDGKAEIERVCYFTKFPAPR